MNFLIYHGNWFLLAGCFIEYDQDDFGFISGQVMLEDHLSAKSFSVRKIPCTVIHSCHMWVNEILGEMHEGNPTGEEMIWQLIHRALSGTSKENAVIPVSVSLHIWA